MAAKTVDEYLSMLEPWQAEIIREIRKMIMREAPQARETFKWSRPVYELNGPLAYAVAYRQHVNLGFERGADLDDPAGLLQGTGVNLRHIKITSLQDMDVDAISNLICQAVALDQDGGT